MNISIFFKPIIDTLERILLSGEKIPAKLMKFIIRLFREFKRDKCLIRASSLSYTSLLALIPLTALSFSLFTAFDAFKGIKDSVQRSLVNILIPTRQDEILIFIDKFLDNSKTMGIIGLLLFAVTSVMLLSRISESFNSIWGSKNEKNFIGKFTSYFSVIVFGTLFIGTSFTLTTPLRNFLDSVPEIQFIIRWLVVLFPSIFIFFTFILMISAIPVGKVNLKSSFIGALAGTVMWDIARRAFTEGAGYVIGMSKLYGSIAVIPIFLFWLYLIWIIIFLSLEISYVHQHKTGWDKGDSNQKQNLSLRIERCLAVFHLIADNFDTGKEYYSVSEISLALSLSEELIEDIVEIFIQAGFIYKTDESVRKLLPSRSLSKIMLKDVIKAIVGDQGLLEYDSAVFETTKAFLSSGYKSIGAITIEDFLKKS
ncbi:MAG: YihY family inner membrane protein [Spirochaetia bacterium]|nr:YihY family inner membrane protein [Spirochaetia bacterium]